MPRPCLLFIELIFSSFSPALKFVMKFSAFVFTSGLGKNNGVVTSAPSIAVGVLSDSVSVSVSSISGEPLLELMLLSTLT